MGFGSNDPILLPTIETLNRIRNQVAHSFALDRDALDEMLRINQDEYDDFEPKNDGRRVQFLRAICRYICLRTAGEIEAAYFIAANTELVLPDDR